MVSFHAAGAYPASLDDAETERILSTMLELGMNTFVCLQAEVNINTPEHAWRAGHGLRPYIKDAQKILSKVCVPLSYHTPVAGVPCPYQWTRHRSTTTLANPRLCSHGRLLVGSKGSGQTKPVALTRIVCLT